MTCDKDYDTWGNLIELPPGFWEQVAANPGPPVATKDCDVCGIVAGVRHRVVHMTTHVVEWTVDTETGEEGPLMVRCVDWPYGEEPVTE